MQEADGKQGWSVVAEGVTITAEHPRRKDDRSERFVSSYDGIDGRRQGNRRMVVDSGQC